MLRNMFLGKPPASHDRILDFSRAVTGTLFFVPTADFLAALAAPAPATDTGWATNGPPPPTGFSHVGPGVGVGEPAAVAVGVASRSQVVYGLHAVRTLFERRPETIVSAKVLRDASGKLAELARTFAETAGIEPPAFVDGRSLLPLLDEPGRPWRQSFLIERRQLEEQFIDLAERQGMTQEQLDRHAYLDGLRTRQWTYVEYGSGERELVTLRWGLVPSWAKDIDIGARLINARAETACREVSERYAGRLADLVVVTTDNPRSENPAGIADEVAAGIVLARPVRVFRRLRILRLLAAERLNVTELTGILGLAQSGVSRHLGMLKEAGLVAEQREGAYTWYRLAPALQEAGNGFGALWPLLRQHFVHLLLGGDQAVREGLGCLVVVGGLGGVAAAGGAHALAQPLQVGRVRGIHWMGGYGVHGEHVARRISSSYP